MRNHCSVYEFGFEDVRPKLTVGERLVSRTI